MPTPSKTLTPRGWALLIILLSLAVKVALVLVAGAKYDLVSDDRSYIDTARIWVETGTFTYNDPTTPTVFVMPAFPALLALIYSLTGDGFVFAQTVRVVQAVLVSAALFIVFETGRRVFSDRAAGVAICVAALYPPFWLMGNLVLTEALFVVPLALLVFTSVRALETPSPKWAVLFALAWAASVYVRPAVALWPGLFLLLLFHWRPAPVRQLAKAALVAASVFILCLSPWWVRNYRATGHFVALTKSSGNPLLLGTFIGGGPPTEVQASWYSSSDVWVNDDLDLKWAKQRIRDGFRDHFREYLGWYTYGKLREFWKMYYWLPIAGIPDPVVSAWHKVVVLMGLIGMGLARKSRPALLLVSLLIYVTLLHMIFLGHGRYSAPFMPVVILFAGHAAVELTRRFRKATPEPSR